MRQIPLFLSVLCLLTVACKKHKESQRAYVPGMLLVGVNRDVSISAAFDLADNPDMIIRQINGYVYKTPYPKDSVTSLTNFLNTKNYIDTFQFKAAVVYTVGGYTAVECTYQYMNSTAQNDWISTMQQIHLTEVIPPSDTLKNMVITVPVGQEQMFKDKLRQDPNVSWVEFNYLEHLQL